MRLEGYGARKPGQLSGGQRQRVALARAIVNRPQALLLDEPLGALDLKLRQELQVELKRIQQELGITFIYVTHDQEEALTMSDRLAVFNDGRIEQIGAPAEVYEHPASEFIAGFVGVSNVLERDGRRFTVRPEKIRLLGEGESPRPGAVVEAGRIANVVYVGAITRYHVELDAGGELILLSQNLEGGSSEVLERQGTRIRASWLPEHAFHNRDRVERRRRGMSKRRVGRWAAALLATGVLSVMAAGCGGDDDDEAGGAGTTAAETTGGTPEGMMESLGEGEGQVNLIAWAGYVEDGSTDPKVDWVTDFEKETGLPGQRQDRQHVGRDGDADAHRRVRRRLGLRRREPAPDRGRRRRAREPRADPELRERVRGPEEPAAQHGRRHLRTACRTAAGRTCSSTARTSSSRRRTRGRSSGTRRGRTRAR